jgi:hypothetical protein
MKNTISHRIKTVLGNDAYSEAFERISTLFEKGSIYFEKDIHCLKHEDLITLCVSLLEMLRVSAKQIPKLLDYGYTCETENDRKKFLNLIMDLLKTGMITSWEFEALLKEPEGSSIPWLVSSLEDETEKLLSALIIGYPGEIEKNVNDEELKRLIATNAECAA